jgi:hypothetical protein
MKKLMTASILALMSLAGAARCDVVTGPAPAAPGAPAATTAPAGKPAEQKTIKLEQVGQMLQAMGYEPKETKDKDGKLTGFVVKLTRNNLTFTICIGVAASETVVWLDTRCLDFKGDDVATAEALLEILAQQHKLWPAYVVHYKNGNVLELSMPVEVRDLTPQKLRTALDEMASKYFIVADAYKAAKTKVPGTPVGQRN